MDSKLNFKIVYSEFNDIIGPFLKTAYPEIDKDIGNLISMKSIDILSEEEIINSKSLAFLPFPKINKKGIARCIEWKDESSRGGIGTGAITLIFGEFDDLIYYKYIKDLEEVFDQASEKIIELKISKSSHSILYKEIKNIHSQFLNRLEQLRNQEMGFEDISEEFPNEKLVKTLDEISFKIVICGDPTCGKTSIILRFTDQAFRRTYLPTLGVNITNKDVQVDNTKASLVLWDIAGQMKFKVLRNQFYSGAKAVLLLFDVTRINTFKSISNWYTDIKKTLKSEENLIVILCGNKIDLIEQRKVNTVDAQRLATEINVDYVETSALTGENIDQTFNKIVKKVIEKL